MALLILGEIGRFMCAVIQRSCLMIAKVLSATCPLNKMFSMAPSSSSHQIKRISGLLLPSLQVALRRSFLLHNLTLLHPQEISRSETCNCFFLSLFSSSSRMIRNDYSHSTH